MTMWLVALAMLGARIDVGQDCSGFSTKKPSITLSVCDCARFRVRNPSYPYDHCPAPHGMWAMHILFRVVEVNIPKVGQWAEYESASLYGKW